MEKDNFFSLIWQGSQDLSISLGNAEMELFWIYLKELLEWNAKLNLTAVTDPKEIIIKHFIDSLTPLPYLERAGPLLDIGSGAGFPGLPIKIAAPQLEVQVLDATRKKVTFLKHLIRTLGLKGVTAVHGRIEDMPPEELTFQVFISRAFRRLEALLRVVSPCLQPSNTLIAMLGPTLPSDQQRMRDLGSREGLDLRRHVSLALPFDRGRRTLLFFQKE